MLFFELFGTRCLQHAHAVTRFDNSCVPSNNESKYMLLRAYNSDFDTFGCNFTVANKHTNCSEN